MKPIKLISDSTLIKEHQFDVIDFYGKETVALRNIEKEFVEQSVYYGLYTTDFEAVACKREETDEIKNDDQGGNGRDKYTTRLWICPTDFYIARDKGTKGYESTMSAFKGHIDETDDEHIITVTEVNDSETITKVNEALKIYFYTVGHMFNEHLTVNIDKFGLNMNDVIKYATETMFLDIDEKSGDVKVLVSPRQTGYQIETIEYKPIEKNNMYGNVAEQDYIYRKCDCNIVEILQIDHFAHSLYAKFYAVAKVAYVYPRDKAEIQEKFPEFYEEHCCAEYELANKKLIKNAVVVPLIPMDSQIGDEVIYRELNFRDINVARRWIKDGTFHALVDNCGFVSAFDTEMRADRGGTFATLVQIGDKFKILFYRSDNSVEYNGKYYVKFTYTDETDFFFDFSGYAPRGNYKKMHIEAYKSVKYLLFKGDIAPVQVSRERYEQFKREKPTAPVSGSGVVGCS